LKLQAVPRDPIPYLYIKWSLGLPNYELYVQFKQPAVTTVKNVKLISMSCYHVPKYGPEMKTKINQQNAQINSGLIYY